MENWPIYLKNLTPVHMYIQYSKTDNVELSNWFGCGHGHGQLLVIIFMVLVTVMVMVWKCLGSIKAWRGKFGMV